MATDSKVQVTPIAQRAKWAQQPTQYDDGGPPPRVPQQSRPVMQRLAIMVEGTPAAIDRVLAYAELHVNVKGTY